MYLYGIAILAFSLTCGGTALLLKSRVVAHFLDVPNNRSLHKSPIPRAGGVIIILSIFLTWLAGEMLFSLPDGAFDSFGAFGTFNIPATPATEVAYAYWLPLLMALGLMAFSLLDDKMGLPVLLRLFIHLLAATFLILFYRLPGFSGSTFFASSMVVVLIVGVAWMTNLFNFMDGSDGLAAGVAMLGFIALAAIAFHAGDLPLAAFCLTVAAATLGFLLFNWSPARIFMGDAGSIPLGFLIGSIGVVGWVEKNWPLWTPLIVFSPFWVDATITLLRRALRGEKIWQAHRQHYYQRLILLGWSHRQTALAYYLLMLVCAIVAYLDTAAWRQNATNVTLPGLSIAFLAFVYLVAGGCVDRSWRRHIRRTNPANPSRAV